MRILVVEDDKKVAGFIKKGLKEEQYAVDVCHDEEKALFYAQNYNYDLIILDIMLPRRDGMSVCKELRRQRNNVPIIMLTARDDVTDKISGLYGGADDYLTKPFIFSELLARVKALLRRTQHYKNKTDILQVADLTLDTAARTTVRGGKNITLTGKEYALLEYFLRNMGKVVNESMILEHVWDMEFEPSSNVVNVYINRLREKIDKGFNKRLIHTIRGLGYKIEDHESS